MIMSVKDMMMIGMMTAVAGAIGFIPAIPIPGIIPPITLQSIAPILAGGILGARRGALSMVVFVVLVACSVPMLAGMRGGLGHLLGPTGGYIFSWILVAFFVGLFVSYVPKLKVWSLVLVSAVLSMVIQYLFGAVSISFTSDMSYTAALQMNVIFMPGDVLKAIVASMVIVRVRHALYGYGARREDVLRNVS